MFDLMPNPALIYHEWNRHGTCSGLTAQKYFDTLRKARAAVNVPPNYLRLDQPITVTPGEVAEAFRKANPELTAANFAVACDKTRLTEVRICLARDFSFRDCAEIVHRACRRERLAMPAVRGG